MLFIFVKNYYKKLKKKLVKIYSIFKNIVKKYHFRVFKIFKS